jgi:hypothetical protein
MSLQRGAARGGRLVRLGADPVLQQARASDQRRIHPSEYLLAVR